MKRNELAFLAGAALGATAVAILAYTVWPRPAPPVHYEHIADIPRTAGEATMTALVVEREPRPDGERRMGQPAWTRIIGCPEPQNVGPIIFSVSDDGLWSETQEGQFVPITYFKWPGGGGEPPRYEFRGYAVREPVTP